jgi:hypothetical protein
MKTNLSHIVKDIKLSHEKGFRIKDRSLKPIFTFQVVAKLSSTEIQIHSSKTTTNFIVQQYSLLLWTMTRLPYNEKACFHGAKLQPINTSCNNKGKK